MNVTADQIDRLLDEQLTPMRTLALVALGCVGLLEGLLLLSLVATEPEPLPVDTTVALVLVACGGFVWAAFALWRLTHRHAVMLRDRVVAWAIAAGCSTVALIGSVVIALGRDRPMVAATLAVAGVLPLGAAGLLLRTNLARYRRAKQRLWELQSQS